MVEARGGAAAPLGAFREGLASAAPTFGLHVVYRGGTGWGQYVGFSQHRFGCATGTCPLEEYVLTAWDLGLVRTLGRHAWLRAGLTAGHTERQRAPGGASAAGEEEIAQLSSLGVGAEVGAGLRLAVAERIGLGPAVRYGRLNTSYPGGGRLEMRWLVVDLGVAIGF